MSEYDTIAALSTPPGTGGISCIRISGEKAFDIAASVFRGKKAFEDIKSHTVSYGKIIGTDGGMIDEAIILKMSRPKTYTKEDVVEIQCHGGTMASRAILDELFKIGAVPAQPGEFTKRAFLNGRIDLSQAEAVMDLINAGTGRSEKSAAMQLEGRTGKRIREIREDLIFLMSRIGVSIDYPEYEDEDIALSDAVAEAEKIRKKLLSLIENYETGRILREGLNVAVIGPPNAGKSTFINAVTGEEKAIVTHIPGTTRDVLEVRFSLKGFPVILHDTAGIRQTEDFIERIGIEKTFETRDKSEIIVMILDAGRGLDQETKELIDGADKNNTIFVINKIDKGPHEKISVYVGGEVIKACLLEDEGTEEILESLYSRIGEGTVDIRDMAVTNARHKMHIDRALSSVEKAVAAGSEKGFLDLLSVDLAEAAEELGMITGESAGEDMIRTIFSRFCVGK